MKKADLRTENARLHRINAAQCDTIATLRAEIDRLTGRAEAVTPAPSLVDRTRDAVAGWLDGAVEWWDGRRP